MAPTAFKDIGKLCSDLLTKDYKTGTNTIDVKSKVPNGITFTPKAEKSGDKFTGSLAAKASVCPGADVELTLKTSGVVAANVEAANMFTSGLTLTLDCETPAPGKAGLLAIGKGTVDYKSDALTCKASYDYYKGEAHAAASSAFKALTFGASADYSVAKSALAKYAAACQFVQPDFTVVAKLDEAIGKADGMVYTASYYHKVSPKMQVGTEVSKASKKSDVALAFGCQYRLDKDLVVKGKVDAEGMLSASYKHTLSKVSTLTLATTIDTVNLAESSKHKFGLVLNLTPC